MLENKPKRDLLEADSFLLGLSHVYKYHNNFTKDSRKNYLRIKDECHKMLYSNDVMNYGIFNEWWDSAGGGEKHALDFIDALKDKGQIDLLSFKQMITDNLQHRHSSFSNPAIDTLLQVMPREPFSSIPPDCQRMENYWMQQCVTASAGSKTLFKTNDPTLAKYGE